MGGWVEVESKPTPPRRPNRSAFYTVKLQQQTRQWFKLCLDDELMTDAMIGCMRLRVWYESDSFRVRKQLYQWARVHAQEWDIPLAGALYATLICAACWQSAMFVRSETGDEYIMTNWSKV